MQGMGIAGPNGQAPGSAGTGRKALEEAGRRGVQMVWGEVPRGAGFVRGLALEWAGMGGQMVVGKVWGVQVESRQQWRQVAEETSSRRQEAWVKPLDCFTTFPPTVSCPTAVVGG